MGVGGSEGGTGWARSFCRLCMRVCVGMCVLGLCLVEGVRSVRQTHTLARAMLTHNDPLALLTQRSVFSALLGRAPSAVLTLTFGCSAIPSNAGVRVRTLEYTDDMEPGVSVCALEYMDRMGLSESVRTFDYEMTLGWV